MPTDPRVMSLAEESELTRCDESSYDELLAVKCTHVRALMNAAVAGEVLPALEVHGSPKSGFRQRANFRVWHQGDEPHLVMFSQAARNQPLIVSSIARCDARINAILPAVLAACRASTVLRFKLIEVRVHSTLRGGAMVLLAYNQAIGEAWEAAASKLAADLDCVVIGRSRKIQLFVGGAAPAVEEVLRVDLGEGRPPREIRLTQLEGEFSQPNGAMCEKMLAWAVRATEPRAEETSRDLLELYCGNGNFTAALAPNFRNVLATELSGPNSENCRENMTLNGLANVKVARLTAADTAEALKRERDFRRLLEADVHLDDYDLSTVFVDPPRAGLDDHSLGLARTLAKVVYVSCNPATLARDVHALRTTHALTKFALFDQFPYTEHAECGAVLERRPDWQQRAADAHAQPQADLPAELVAALKPPPPKSVKLPRAERKAKRENKRGPKRAREPDGTLENAAAPADNAPNAPTANANANARDGPDEPSPKRRSCEIA